MRIDSHYDRAGEIKTTIENLESRIKGYDEILERYKAHKKHDKALILKYSKELENL